MHKVFSCTIALLFCLNCFSQVKEGGYYFLEHPTRDIFKFAFSKPMPSDGKTDPKVVQGNEINESSIYSSRSAAFQTMDFNKNTELKILSTFSRTDSIAVTAKFYAVRIDRLTESGFNNIKDGFYHVTEALRADSIVISFKRTNKVVVSSKDLTTALSSFIPSYTVYGMLSKALNFDSTKSKLVGWNGGSGDSVKAVIKDSMVYFAARYIAFDDQKEALTLRGWLGKIIGRHNNQFSEYVRPNIENKKNTANTTVAFPPNVNPVRLNLFPDPTNNTDLKINPTAFLVYDTTTKKGYVEFINRGVSGGEADKRKTTYTLDFGNDYYSSAAENSAYLFLSRDSKNVSKYLWLDFKLQIDPAKRQLIIFNRDGNFASGLSKTCIYTTTGKYDLWPK